ncbi:MAG: oligosaccharide flippase family protein, partial [Bacteroidota bacterium]
GSGSFGIINLGLAVFYYGLIISSPGLHTIGTRIVSRGSSNDAAVIKQVTALRFILALLTCTVMTIASFFLVHDATIRLILILYAVSILPFAFQIEWFYQGKQRVAALGASRATALLSFVVLLFFLVTSQRDILLVPVVYFVNVVVNAAILFLIYWKEKQNTFGDDAALPINLGWKSLLRQSLPVGAAAIIAQAVLNLPVILLGFFATSFDIGNFSAASKLIFFLLSIDRAVYILFYPLVARSIATTPGEVGKQVSRILNYMLMIILPICMGGFVLARPVVMIIFGSQYENSVVVAQILIFYFLFTILNSIFAFVVIAAGKEKNYSAVIITVSSVLLVLLVPLTYYWKAPGASCGMVAGECLMMVLMYRQCCKSISTTLVFRAIKPLICSAIMGAVLFTFSTTTPFLSIPIGIGIYSAFMFLLKGIQRDDIVFLKERLL